LATQTEEEQSARLNDIVDNAAENLTPTNFVESKPKKRKAFKT